ncbi:Helix-turn-helix domain-containing protein [Gracilibacillus orientalis]|uniref:Helix-turn-helix domain-containing protein n=1 Tax=Gracilibacillus orientalis TaxID=334253 RepID=A0A1I4JTL0_9BACI|nr:response regulator transcription factor [Gracilibacillus orientalis]SFL69547.1 Helix-turn-helix domain-containing protein [Gracilibacillus orientalis]
MQFYVPLQPPILQKELLDSNYQYQEYLPNKNLESYVACYWTVNFHSSEQNKLHRIIPDGCADIIFDLRSSSFSKGAFVVGLMTEFESINLTQKCSLFGIRFYSDTVHHFLRHPVSEFIENHVFLEDIWGREATFITEEIISSNGISRIIEKVELKLMKFLQLSKSKPNYLLQTGLQYIYANNGVISIRSLAEKLHYSERNIRRTFHKELGVSPKELSGIIRFQSVLQELYNSNQYRFTNVAAKYGYSDQSHFINHFKRYYGISPNEILK